ncbi:hypothetical protein B0H14DRAFT_3459252 [Mycena olivaceomarginata]|nr:hypothetical protein B0H14DRAFT_3459252 [Mycena olivaceomarginata]
MKALIGQKSFNFAPGPKSGKAGRSITDGCQISTFNLDPQITPRLFTRCVQSDRTARPLRYLSGGNTLPPIRLSLLNHTAPLWEYTAAYSTLAVESPPRRGGNTPPPIRLSLLNHTTPVPLDARSRIAPRALSANLSGGNTPPPIRLSLLNHTAPVPLDARSRIAPRALSANLSGGNTPPRITLAVESHRAGTFGRLQSDCTAAYSFAVESQRGVLFLDLLAEFPWLLDHTALLPLDARSWIAPRAL